MPVSVSWPANEPSFSASATNGFSFGASSAVIEGKLTALEIAPRKQIVGHLLGDLQRDVLLRFRGRGAEMRRADHVGRPNSGSSVAGSSTNTSNAAPATCPELSASTSAASSTRPPRAQLIDAHALLHLGERLGVDDVAGLVGERRVQRDEIGAAQQLVELDLLDAEVHARARRTGTDRRRSPSSSGRCARSATIEPILPQPMTPSVLPEISTPMKRFFSHLPAWVEASASGIWRASASISVIACSAVVIELPNGVFITMMPRAVAAGMSTLSTPMPARPITFRLVRLFEDLRRGLGGGADGEAVIVADDLGELVLVLAEIGLEVDLDAAILEDRTAAGDSASEMRTLGAMSFVSTLPSRKGKGRPEGRGGFQSARRVITRIQGPGS